MIRRIFVLSSSCQSFFWHCLGSRQFRQRPAVRLAGWTKLSAPSMAGCPPLPVTPSRSIFSVEPTTRSKTGDRAESACKKAVRWTPTTSRYHRWLGVFTGRSKSRELPLCRRPGGKVRDEFQRAVDLDQADTNAELIWPKYFLEAPGIVGGGQDKARTAGKDHRKPWTQPWNIGYTLELQRKQRCGDCRARISPGPSR